MVEARREPRKGRGAHSANRRSRELCRSDRGERSASLHYGEHRVGGFQPQPYSNQHCCCHVRAQMTKTSKQPFIAIAVAEHEPLDQSLLWERGGCHGSGHGGCVEADGMRARRAREKRRAMQQAAA